MEMEIITNAVGGVLTNIALAALTLLGAYAVYYIRLGAVKLKAQTKQIADVSARELLENALDDVERLAVKAVNYTEQTVAKALREAVKAGSGDREQLLALGQKVFAQVKGEIAPESQRIITKNLGSFDRYLQQCIEEAVLKVKQADPYLTLPEGVLMESVATAAAG